VANNSKQGLVFLGEVLQRLQYYDNKTGSQTIPKITEFFIFFLYHSKITSTNNVFL